MKVYDLKFGNWTNSSIAVSGQNQYQRLIPDSLFLDRMQLFFLISIDNVVVVEYVLLLSHMGKITMVHHSDPPTPQHRAAWPRSPLWPLSI